MAVLEGIDHGDGYDITSADVMAAYKVVRQAADHLGKPHVLETWRAHRPQGSFVQRVLSGRP